MQQEGGITGLDKSSVLGSGNRHLSRVFRDEEDPGVDIGEKSKKMEMV